MGEIEDIERNSVRCGICGDEIVSNYTHDFKMCSCGNVGVDGGHDYRRRVYRTEQWEDTSVYTVRTIDRPYPWEV